MPKTKKHLASSDDQAQIDKFKDAARELETDDREEAFDEKLKKVAARSADNARESRVRKKD